MDANAPRDLFTCFKNVPDPRMHRTGLHRLDDILAIAIAIAITTVICDGERPAAMQHFAEDRYDGLKMILHLPAGVPSHDTFGRVLTALDPDAFECCLIQCVQALVQTTGERALHIDRKTLRRSFDTASRLTSAPHHKEATAGTGR